MNIPPVPTMLNLFPALPNPPHWQRKWIEDHLREQMSAMNAAGLPQRVTFNCIFGSQRIVERTAP